MDIIVEVVNQRLKITTNLKDLVAGTENFIRFVFDLSGDWDGLSPFVQFVQNGVPYNVSLNADNCAFLPKEIGPGKCTMVLAGNSENKMAVTNYLTLTIDSNILITEAES